eukprot:g3781.t1
MPMFPPLARFFSSTVKVAEATKVVCVGLGNMGYPLAGRISDAGFQTTVFDLDAAAVEKHNSEHGSASCSSLEEEVSKADVLVSCLPNSIAVRKVRSLLAGHHKANSVWLDATSGDPVETAELADDLLKTENVRFVDCAVSGGPHGCRKGALATMIGGDSEAFEQLRPIINTFSSNINYLGPSGAGHAVKAVNNTLLAINIWASGEALLALKKRGVDPSAAAKAISGSSGRNWGTMQRFPDNILTGKHDYGFALGLHAKDVRTAIRMLGETPAPMMRTADQMLQVCKAELGFDADHTEVVRVLEKWMDQDLLE